MECGHRMSAISTEPNFQLFASANLCNVEVNSFWVLLTEKKYFNTPTGALTNPKKSAISINSNKIYTWIISDSGKIVFVLEHGFWTFGSSKLGFWTLTNR